MQHFRKPIPAENSLQLEERQKYPVGTINVATFSEIGYAHPKPDILAVPVKQVVKPSAFYLPTKCRLEQDYWNHPYSTETPNISIHRVKKTLAIVPKLKSTQGSRFTVYNYQL